MTENTPPPDMKAPPDPPSPDAPTPRRGKGLRWALGISLALNLLVVGVLAGASIAALNSDGRKGGGPGPAVFGQSIGPVIQSFDPQDRRAMARAMRRGAQEIGLSRRSCEEGLQQLSTQIAAEPFDRAALVAVMEQQRDQVQAVQTLALQVILERISMMSDEERARLAERLEARSKDFSGGRPPQKQSD